MERNRCAIHSGLFIFQLGCRVIAENFAALIGAARGRDTNTRFGSPGKETAPTRALALPRRRADLPVPDSGEPLPPVHLSSGLAEDLSAAPGDLLYITDPRWWTGGLHSAHAIVTGITEEPEPIISIGDETFKKIVTPSREQCLVRVERLYGTGLETAVSAPWPST